MLLMFFLDSFFATCNAQRSFGIVLKNTGHFDGYFSGWG